MIDRLIGSVLAQTPISITVLVGGVGILVYVPKNVLDQTASGQIDLYTHLIVREDSLSLYGFKDEMDRMVFEALLKVNGVGPRMAIAVLSTLTVDHLRSAVARDEADILTRVPGVGKKTASKIVLDLKDKLGWKGSLADAPAYSDVDSDVLDTLIALGYSVVEAQSAIQSIPKNTSKELEERVRVALQYFT